MHTLFSDPLVVSALFIPALLLVVAIWPTANGEMRAVRVGPSGEITPATGWHAGVRYLRLALRAFLEPLRQRRRPRTGWGMQAYLLLNCLLYGLATLSFLAPVPHLAVSTRDPVFGSGLAHLLWGLTGAAVCLAQIAALLVDEWRVWLVCATLTAMWALAFWVALFLDAIVGMGGG